MEVAKRRGLRLDLHRSRPYDQDGIAEGDLLAAMEPMQGKLLSKILRQTGVQVTLVGLWHKCPRPYIQDPYGLSTRYFESCFSFLDESIEEIMVRINASRER